VAFDVEWQHERADLHRALNAVLAADVAIVALGVAQPGFHPRFDARSRTYRYTILTRPERSPLERRTAWHVSQPVAVEPMAEASRSLLGRHDFRTFGRPPQGENSLRMVGQADWKAWAEECRLTFDITADAFLYHMVRGLVGTLVLVGSGHLSPDEFEAMLLAQDPSRVKQIAPAHGLCLVRVDYDEGVIQ
jgi:tRNA pseudouridine38-40 synthase